MESNKPHGSTTLQSTEAGADVPTRNISDESLDAGKASDETYLASLGYKQELRRALGFFSSFGVQFSSIAVATSMFTVLGVGLTFFGPASFWAFLIGGALQVFAVGFAVAELVSAYPVAGGVYQITNRITKRPWLGWQTGWWLIIAHSVSVTAVAVAMAPFVADWFGVTISSPAQALPWALGLIVLACVVNLVGVRVVAFVNNIGVVAELVAAALILVTLLVVRHPTQHLSFLTNTGGTVTNGNWLLPLLFACIVPTYIISSFDSSGNAGEETRDAARTAPRALLTANATAWIIGSVFMLLMYLAIQNLPEIMGSSLPAKDILDRAVGTTVTSIFQALAIAALFANLCVIQLTGVRVLWAMARDGQMPFAHWLRKVGNRQIPLTATLVIFVLSCLFALWSSALAVLGAMAALSWALAYTVVVIVGLWALVKKRLPARPFSAGKLSPLVFTVAIVWSFVLCTALVWSDPKRVGGGMLAAIVVGVILYVLIPASRRGKVVGVTHDTVVLSED